MQHETHSETIQSQYIQPWNPPILTDFSNLRKAAFKKSLLRLSKDVALALLEVLIFSGMGRLLHLW